GAGVLAAPALDAGVEVEPPLPGEVLELAHPEVLRLLDVLDLGELAAGPELGEEHVDGRGDEGHEIRPRNEGDENERDGGVEEPQRYVNAARRRRRQPGRGDVLTH